MQLPEARIILLDHWAVKVTFVGSYIFLARKRSSRIVLNATRLG